MMEPRDEMGGGFTVLDGVAVITGSAVALVHIRSAVPGFDGAGDWAWACALLVWLSVTSAGPFIYLVRRFFAKPEGYPRLGDRLWALAGSPWWLAAIVRSGEPEGVAATGQLDPAYVGCLSIGLAASAMVTVVVLAGRYLLGDPAREKPAPSVNWTDRTGLFLAVTWPIQCGVGLMVMG